MFRFKQFNVDQTGCAMKINTDGVLLGALAGAGDPQTILDIGTGTGVIALMLAQRFMNAQVNAVEIDETAAKTAGRNFAGSRFADRLHIYSTGFEIFFEQHPDTKYNLIVSNPPFYINSLASPGIKKNLAKHTDGYFFETLIKYASAHLAENGELWLILPLQTAELVEQIAKSNRVYLQKKVNILSYPNSIPHRKILVLALGEIKYAHEQFVIYTQPKVYTEEYQHTLENFFTIF